MPQDDGRALFLSKLNSQKQLSIKLMIVSLLNRFMVDRYTSDCRWMFFLFPIEFVDPNSCEHASIIWNSRPQKNTSATRTDLGIWRVFMAESKGFPTVESLNFLWVSFYVSSGDFLWCQKFSKSPLLRRAGGGEMLLRGDALCGPPSSAPDEV